MESLRYPTATTPADSRAGAAARAQPRSPVQLMLHLVLWLLLSLGLTILIEWAGITWWWPEQGVAHVQQTLREDSAYLSTDLRRSAFVQDAQAYAAWVGAWGYRILWEWTGLRRAVAWAAEAPPQSTTLRQRIQAFYRTHLSEYVITAAYATQVFLQRLAILTLALPVFVLAATLGLVDGINLRRLRRWGGGRESSFVYHHTKRLIWPVFVLPWSLYLAMPVSLHPAWIVLPMAGVLGLLLAVVVARFKKHL